MAVSEESRHHLYQRLEEVLGREETKVLMGYLPPVGWADVAAKRDLDALESRMDMRFDRVDERFAGADRRLTEMDRRWDERFTEMDRRWDERFTEMDRRWDERFTQVDRRLERLEGIPREFRSLLYALMSFMAVMVGAMVAAIKI